MKKKLLSIFVVAAMICTMLSGLTITASAVSSANWTKLSGSTTGKTIGVNGQTQYYYIEENTACSNTTTGGSGLAIVNGATVYIYIPADVTLTCTGTNGSGTTGGGAGIWLPNNAKLYIIGNGKLVANGGKAGNGSSGYNAGSGYVKDANGNSYTAANQIYWGWYLVSGAGGKGGSGGGGAGAGIGTPGATGGAGGNGGSSAGTSYYLNQSLGHLYDIWSDSGKDGSKGTNAQSAAAMGTLYKDSTVIVEATGGAAGTAGGSQGYIGSSKEVFASWDGSKRDAYYQIGASGGGGGGGAGYAGANIGTGGYSGAGGGGGASGGTCYYDQDFGPTTNPLPSTNPNSPYKYADGGGGTGGYGAVAGITGAGTKKSSYYWNNSSSRYEVPGGSAGASGNAGAAGTEKATQPASLYASLTFNANGGTLGETNPTTATVGADMPAVSKPTRTGYTFVGWYDAETGGKQYYDENCNSTRVMTYCDITLYAQWTVNTYNVTLDTNGGTCDELTSYTYGEGAKLPIPTKAGYNFTGWYDNADFEGNPVTEITTTDTGDKEFYAKWEIIAEIKDSSDTVEFPKVQSKITGDTAVMRFMWQVIFDENAKIDNIGAYIIPWSLFDDYGDSFKNKSGIVKYDEPEIQSGDTFSADLTEIPKMAGEHNVFNEMEISAFPFINGKLLGNFITSTVEKSDIDSQKGSN